MSVVAQQKADQGDSERDELDSSLVKNDLRRLHMSLRASGGETEQEADELFGFHAAVSEVSFGFSLSGKREPSSPLPFVCIPAARGRRAHGGRAPLAAGVGAQRACRRGAAAGGHGLCRRRCRECVGAGGMSHAIHSALYDFIHLSNSLFAPAEYCQKLEKLIDQKMAKLASLRSSSTHPATVFPVSVSDPPPLPPPRQPVQLPQANGRGRKGKQECQEAALRLVIEMMA